MVLMLGDQPGVTSETVRRCWPGAAPLAVCRYDDGDGHPIAFARSVFADLADLHGDKGVWRLLDRRAAEVERVPIAGPVPRDVDTLEDYQAVLDESDARMNDEPPWFPMSRRWPGASRRSTTVDEGLATSMFLSLRLPQPLLLEGEAGVGKTEAARSVAAVLDTPLIRLQCYEGSTRRRRSTNGTTRASCSASGSPTRATPR